MKKSIFVLLCLILLLTSTFADMVSKNRNYSSLQGNGADSPEVVKYQIWNLSKNNFFKKGNIIKNNGNPSVQE